MANPTASLNPNDPIVQALRAEAAAKEIYSDAGHHRNFLEQKVKKGDAKAMADLPAAQKRVEIAQENLKRAQIALARLTGTPNPHVKQRVAHKTPVKADKAAGTEKVAIKNPELKEAGEKVLPVSLKGKKVQDLFTPTQDERRIIEFIERTRPAFELKKIWEKPLKNNERSVPLFENLRVPRGEVMTGAYLKRTKAPTVQGLKAFLETEKTR